MSEPFLGEIRTTSFSFAPRGWALCNGQLLPINSNQALFSLLGTMYGGDGRVTFALPDLRGRTPVHANAGLPQGTVGGEEGHALSQAEIPAHTHQAQASSQRASLDDPTDAVLAATTTNGYAGSPNGAMHPSAITTAGSSQPHQNMQPYLVLNHIIALQGIFPSRN